MKYSSMFEWDGFYWCDCVGKTFNIKPSIFWTMQTFLRMVNATLSCTEIGLHSMNVWLFSLIWVLHIQTCFSKKNVPWKFTLSCTKFTRQSTNLETKPTCYMHALIFIFEKTCKLLFPSLQGNFGKTGKYHHHVEPTADFWLGLKLK